MICYRKIICIISFIELLVLHNCLIAFNADQFLDYSLLASFTISSTSSTSSPDGKSVPSGLDSGLYAWYPLDGNINDLSGNGNHGYDPGGAPWPATTGPAYTTNRFGEENEAASFNGTDQYFRSDFASACHQDFTIAFWFYSNVATNNRIMGTQLNPASDPGAYAHVGSSGGAYFTAFYACCSNADGIEASSPATIPTGTWTHYAYVHDGASYHGNLWVNGAYVADSLDFGTSQVCSGGGLQYHMGPLMIGYAYADSHFNGRLEDVWFFQGRQLSGSEISTLMNTN